MAEASSRYSAAPLELRITLKALSLPIPLRAHA
jgi:hypothetical protein